MSNSDFKNYEAERLDSMKKIDFVAEIDLGSVDERTLASYQNFAAAVKRQYKIDVAICVKNCN